MNLLRRLGGLRCATGFNQERLLRRHGSQFLHSRRRSCMELVPVRRHTATVAQPPPPRCVLLNRCGCPRDSPIAADDKTAVGSSTSTGRPFRVSLGLVPPPASSFLYIDWAGRSDGDQEAMAMPHVIAAHGAALLFGLPVHGDDPKIDYFLYSAAGHGGPPSLSLLPACYIPMLAGREREMRKQDTGILRRGEDELLVAQLEVKYDAPDMAELCMLRPGRPWELKREVPIVPSGANRLIDAVVPVGDRFLCWVSYNLNTFLLCDMAEEENPKLHRVHNFGEISPKFPKFRFFRIDPRCCCGGHGSSTCVRSSSAFRVTTWTMRLSAKGRPMAWRKVGVLDSDELWCLQGYEGLPRVWPECPVVSADNPDIVCFLVREEEFVSSQERKVWMLEIDTMKKKLLSVGRCTAPPYKDEHHFSAKLHC
ncbi:hypothetical protein ACP70R_045216 [Stipagrostis hirtigluma subsp. patula]